MYNLLKNQDEEETGKKHNKCGAKQIAQEEGQKKKQVPRRMKPKEKSKNLIKVEKSLKTEKNQSTPRIEPGTSMSIGSQIPLRHHHCRVL